MRSPDEIREEIRLAKPRGNTVATGVVEPYDGSQAVLRALEWVIGERATPPSLQSVSWKS